MPLILREEKGSQLTFNEMDGNLTYLEGLDQEKLTTSSFNAATGSFVTTSSFNAATGSFATTGSNVFVGGQRITGSLNISGSTIQSGSIDISGSINADGFELDTTSTTNIPALNSTFNLDLSGSASTFIQKTLVLNDGKILIAGRFESVNGHSSNHIARLNSNGTVDTSFTAPTIGASIDPGNRYVNNFALQSNGKIIIVGNFREVGVTSRFGVARLNTNGTEDFTFDSSNGLTSVGLIRDVVIQSDDKIIVAGQMEGGIKRMNSDGSADFSFDVVAGFSDNAFYSVALLPSGSEQAILVGGDFQQWDTSSDYKYLVKLNPNGSLDTGFAGTNLDIAAGNSLDRIQKIKTGDDGYIYVAGRFKDTLTGPNVRHAGFARLTTIDEGDGVGAFDSGFRTYITGSDPNNPGTQYVNDFDFYDSNKILLGGSFTTIGIPGYTLQSANRFAIVSQNTGNIISGWAASGSASTYRLNTGSVNSVTLLPNDNVLVGGTFTSASNPLTAREGLASLKLTGFGEVTTTTDYSITANSNQLLISSSNTYFSGNVNISGSITGSLLLVTGSANITGGVTGSSFTGSFVGDGSGLTNIPGVTPIETGSFATTGSNVFVGNQIISGSIFTSGSNLSIGRNAGIALNEDIAGNTFIGADAGENTAIGRTNVFIGRGAGQANVSGSSSVYIGANAGSLSCNNSQNAQLAIGLDAGRCSDAANNTFIGLYSGRNSQSGDNNTFLGAFTGQVQTGFNARCNTFIGACAGTANTTGACTTFVGTNSGRSNTTGRWNTFMGQDAGCSNSVGGGNTFIGRSAGCSNISGSSNTFVGDSAGAFSANPDSCNNSFFGRFAGQSATTGSDLTFLGYRAGVVNKANSNTFVGSSAGESTTVGGFNTFIGKGAGANHISGSNNTFVGNNAGQNAAGANNDQNTFIGVRAGQGTSASGSGFDNVAVGIDSARENYGNYNVFLGNCAGRYLANGSTANTITNNSVYIGYNAKSSADNQTNQIVIGHNAIGNGSNTSTIGNTSTTATYLRGTLITSGSVAQQVTGSFLVTGSANVDGFITYPQVSASLDFADDTAAAAGGVPLGGLYRNGNVIQIRLV